MGYNSIPTAPTKVLLENKWLTGIAQSAIAAFWRKTCESSVNSIDAGLRMPISDIFVRFLGLHEGHLCPIPVNIQERPELIPFARIPCNGVQQAPYRDAHHKTQA